jgi:hypothetical protein
MHPASNHKEEALPKGPFNAYHRSPAFPGDSADRPKAHLSYLLGGVNYWGVGVDDVNVALGVLDHVTRQVR